MSDPRDAVSVERTIAAPPEKIFALLSDPNRHRDIDGSGSVREANEGSTKLALGSEFGMAMKLAGVPYSMVSEVIEYDEDKRIAWQTRPSPSWQRPYFGGRMWRYELEPSTSGTRVRETWDISQEKGPVKHLLRIERSRAHTRHAMEKTLENIERLTASA
jgi:uncharacterized protein YndB with AHSA1/START domain